MDAEPARVEARLEAFRLIEAVQTEDAPSPEELERRVGLADAQDWPEVVHVLLYAGAVRAAMAGNEHSGPAGERLLERCKLDGTPAMGATALAFHASALLAVDRIDASDDAMARAVTLLDGIDGPAMELVTALVQCALVYQRRRLWELCEEVLDRAAALLPECEVPMLEPVVLHNLVEIELEWASALRELGEVEASRERAERGLEAARRLDEVPMPELWRAYGRSMGLVLGALTGTGRHWGPAARAELLTRLQAGGEPYFTGFVGLSAALPALDQGRPADAAREAAVALESFTGGNATSGHLLALRIAAEAEAAADPSGRRAALDYAEHVARLRWHDRLTLLGSVRTRLQAERMRADRDALVRDALIDELTGLANRRGYARYLAARRELGTRRPLAMLTVDLDRFKLVNDVHGHPCGDDVLHSVGGILAGHVRTTDLAVRVGGDEFLVVLEGATEPVARDRAERIAQSIRAERWPEVDPDLRVTASVGVAADAGEDPEALAEAADAALYRAKEAGGDRASA
ncbi:MAG: GGDEF domain-containing protein [Solirubrobacteraceae bacterium]